MHFKQEPCFRAVLSARVSQRDALVPGRASQDPEVWFYSLLKRMEIAPPEQGSTEGSGGSQDKKREG